MTEAPEESKPTLLADALDTLRTVGLALLIALVFRVILFQPYTIPSSSMEPGLITGDYIIVSKFAYGWSGVSLPFAPPLIHGRLMGRGPERGDVVVFRSRNEGGKTLIKRVIGLPGDRVRVSGGRVIINGKALAVRPMGPATDRDTPDLAPELVTETGPEGRRWNTFDRGPGQPGDDTGVYVVPEGDYFMMGDNRDNSLDSRWPAGIGVGFVASEEIVGKAQIILASWNEGASLLKPWTWLGLHWDRFFKPIS